MTIKQTLLLALLPLAAQSSALTQNLTFTPDSVTISGRIIGHDTNTDITYLQMYLYDLATRQNLPKVITVNPDGTFSRTMMLPHAQMTGISLPDRRYASIYLEPGQSLDMTIGLDTPLDVRFGGSLGTINTELAAAPTWESIAVWKITEQTSPAEFKDSVLSMFADVSRATENYIATLPPDSRAPALLRSNILADKGLTLMEYAENNNSHPLLPPEFYTDFVGEMLRADSTLLFTSDSYILHNRLGFSNMLPSMTITANIAEVNRALDFLREHGGEPSSQTWVSITKKVNLSSPDTLQTVTPDTWIRLVSEIYSTADKLGVSDEFTTNFKSKLNNNILFEKDGDEADIAFIKSLAGTEQVPLLWQYVICDLKASYIINDGSDFNPQKYGLSDPFIVSQLREARLNALNTDPKTLPDTDAGQLMAQLIAPFHGKYVLVDFWDMFCGPCRYGIENNKENREKYRNSPEVGFLFICSESGSPLDQYNSYVEEHLKDEQCVRLPDHKIAQLRELFNFSSIPRYVLIGPDGRVINSKYNLFEFFTMMEEKGLAKSK